MKTSARLVKSAQVLLAAVFLVAGLQKLVLSLAELAVILPAAPSWLVRWIGLAETAGALALLLPPAPPRLSAAAALGLFTVMVLAAAAHLARGEAHLVPINAVLGALAAFVAWGRLWHEGGSWTVG